MVSRRGSETSEDSPDLIRLAEEKSKAEADLASTLADLEAANQQLHDARQFEIQNAKLETDLANEQALHKRVTDELENIQSHRDALQTQVQKLTAQISGLQAELEAKNESLREESAENTQLLKQSTELGTQVNTLTAKVSNLNTELKNAEERMEERGQLEKLFGDRFKTMSSETLANQQKQFIDPRPRNPKTPIRQGRQTRSRMGQHLRRIQAADRFPHQRNPYSLNRTHQTASARTMGRNASRTCA